MPRVFLSVASITYNKRNSTCAYAAMTAHGSNSFQLISSPQLQAVRVVTLGTIQQYWLTQVTGWTQNRPKPNYSHYSSTWSQWIIHTHIYNIDECLTVHRRWYEDSKTKSMLHNGLLDLMNRSTCFGHYYAHRQELATIQMAPACGTSPLLRQIAGLVHGCRFLERLICVQSVYKWYS